MNVEVDDEGLKRVLSRAVSAEVSAMLGSEWYQKRQRFTVITEAADRYVASLDLTPYLEEALKECLKVSVGSAVSRAVQNRVGQMMSNLIRSGALDVQIAEAIADHLPNRKEPES